MKEGKKPENSKSGMRKGVVGKVLSGSKKISDFFSSTVKIGFNLILLLFIFSMISSLVGGGSGTIGTATEVLYGKGPEKIVVIDINGVIMDVADEGPFGAVAEPNVVTPRTLLRQFESIKSDDRIGAVILRINSPGGSVVASEEIYQMIMRFRSESGLPVLASYGEIAASGGYYISLAADTIVASPTTLTGSIGAIASILNVKDLADQFGVKEVSVTSGENKNFLSPLQDVDPDQQEQLQTMVDSIHDQFVQRVQERRDIADDAAIAVADGRPLTGEQALSLNLVDDIGSFHDTVVQARERIGAPEAAVIVYKQEGLLQSLFQIAAHPLAGVQKTIRKQLPSSHFFPGTPAYLSAP